jgi:hypothetical protein
MNFQVMRRRTHNESEAVAAFGRPGGALSGTAVMISVNNCARRVAERQR